MEGSQLVVSRTAYRNSRNVYAVNGQTKTYAEVTALLKAHSIDLDHNRFLILQGEVESIALMKPKGANEHEEGLLEYLEDIIGTADYVAKIEEAGKALEEADELVGEKGVRVRAAQKECDALSGEKEQAESFLRQENQLADLKSQRLQALLYKTSKESGESLKRLEANRQKLAEEVAKFDAEKIQIQKLELEIEVKTAQVKEAEGKVKTLSKSLSTVEQEDVRLQETRKHLKNKLKGLSKALAETQKQKNDLVRNLESANFEIDGLAQQENGLQQSLNHEEAELDKICKSLQGVTGKFQSQLEKKQALLVPLNERMRKENQALEVALSAKDSLKQKEMAGFKDLEGLKERLKEIETELKLAKEDKERMEEESERLADSMNRLKAEIQKSKDQQAAVTKEIDMMSSTLAEARESLSQASSGGAILQAIMKEKRSGRLPGIHGRLGDLGTINGKYDTAISTACSFLNHIVVDTTETGQRCIELIRRLNLGRANFIILDKMKQAQPAADLPSGAKRLYDLVKIKDPKLYANAFYFALNETLVADTVDEATKLAYGSKRYRVVTVDGKLFETSGTISGGGRPQKGGMKAAIGGDDVSQEQVDQLESCLNERRQVLRQLANSIVQLESQHQCLLNDKSRNEAQLLKVQANLDSLPKEKEEVESQLAEAKSKSGKLSKKELDRLANLESTIAGAEANIRGIKSEMAPIEGEIAAIQAQIMEAGGIKFKAQKSKVDGLKEQLEHLQDRVKKLVNSKNLTESKLKALESESSGQGSAAAIEAELKGIDGKIEEQTLAAYQIKQELEQASHTLDGLRDELEELSKQLSAFEKGQGKFKKIEYELKVKIEQEEDALKEARSLGQRCEAELRGLSLHHINLNEPRPVLTVYEDEEDLRDLVKKLGQVESQIRVLQERLEALTPNLKVLAEYREKEARLGEAQDELAQLEADRQSKRDAFDSLRRARHDEFMAGFRAISAKLKEMYQLITMGGNAELELVDSLDPFSEGILFSVMPPRKSWKHIANLSGGEKTLSSLALVFALHTYRPTPIYVMDEIDAALDFRNVSIVANYIKERTRDAQFVVISLRSNMFELSDRLVGIYKTEQRTKSVTIDPKNFVVPQPSSVMTTTAAAVSTTN